MAPDTTDDTQHDRAEVQPEAETFFIVTITDAAKMLNMSVRTVQRRLDAGEWEAVMMAGKRCVRLPESALPAGVTPDATRAILDSGTLNLSHDAPDDTQRDNAEHNSAALARVEPHGAAALVAAIVRETLNQTEARAAQKVRVDIADKPLLTLTEVQVLTGLSRDVLRAAIDAGELKAGKIGRAFRVRRSDVQTYLEGLF